MYAFDASTFDVEVARADHYGVPHDAKVSPGQVYVTYAEIRRHLSDTCLQLLSYFHGQVSFKRNGTVFPSVAEMVRVVRRQRPASERAIRYALARLRKAGLVTYAKGHGSNGSDFTRTVHSKPCDSKGLYVPQKTRQWLMVANPMNRPRKKGLQGKLRKGCRANRKRAAGGEYRRKENSPGIKDAPGFAAASLSSSAAAPPAAAPRRSRARAPVESPQAFESTRAPETPSVDVGERQRALRMPELPSADSPEGRWLAALFDDGETLETATLLRESEAASVEQREPPASRSGGRSRNRAPKAPVVDRVREEPVGPSEGGREIPPELLALVRRPMLVLDMSAPKSAKFADDAASTTKKAPIPRAQQPRPQPVRRETPPDFEDVDPATHGLRAGGPDRRREQRLAAWCDEVAKMEPAPLSDAERERAELEAALPAEERARRAALVDSLYAPLSPTSEMPVETLTDDFDYDNPQSYMAMDAKLCQMFSTMPTRIPLDITGLLPEFPSELPRVQAPRFESLKHLDGKPKTELESVKLLARSFRMAMNGHYGGKFHQLRNGDITKSQYYAKLATAAEMFRKRNIYPGLWCFWAIKRWRAKNPMKQPPLGWIFSEKLIASCSHWFDETVRAYTRQLQVSARMDMLELLNKTRHAALSCATREEAAKVIAKKIPPALWRAMARRAHDEAHQMAADVRARFANEEWVWGKF